LLKHKTSCNDFNHQLWLVQLQMSIIPSWKEYEQRVKMLLPLGLSIWHMLILDMTEFDAFNHHIYYSANKCVPYRMIFLTLRFNEESMFLFLWNTFSSGWRSPSINKHNLLKQVDHQYFLFFKYFHLSNYEYLLTYSDVYEQDLQASG
jgi:hypothetical protein